VIIPARHRSKTEIMDCHSTCRLIVDCRPVGREAEEKRDPPR
jgi:hypothetical protein